MKKNKPILVLVIVIFFSGFLGNCGKSTSQPKYLYLEPLPKSVEVEEPKPKPPLEPIRPAPPKPEPSHEPKPEPKPEPKSEQEKKLIRDRKLFEEFNKKYRRS